MRFMKMTFDATRDNEIVKRSTIYVAWLLVQIDLSDEHREYREIFLNAPKYSPKFLTRDNSSRKQIVCGVYICGSTSISKIIAALSCQEDY